MAISNERIKQDLLKIEALAKSANHKIKIKSKSGNPVNKITLELDYPTAPSENYPSQIQHTTTVEIELLSRYPFQEPNVTIVSPIFHPNVYRSGKVCLGTKWLPTEGLDLLVKRIIQIIIFDPLLLNERSPANGSALNWYRQQIVKNPNAFPTDKLNPIAEQKNKIVWNNF